MVICIDPGKIGAMASRVDGEIHSVTMSHEAMIDVLSDRLSIGDTLVIERPMIYPRAQTRNPNHVLDTAVLAGEFGGLARLVLAEVEYVTPAKWSKRIPKKVRHERLKKDDRVPKGLSPHALDAVGMLLWWEDQ